MSNKDLSLTQKELLIRLDERVKSLQSQVSAIQMGLISPSEHTALMEFSKEAREDIESLKNWRAKVIGYIIGAGAASGGLASVVFQSLARLSG